MGSGCCYFIVVDKVMLSKAFGNVLNFILCDLAYVIPFAFANKLTLKGPLALGDGTVRVKNKDMKISQAFEFFLSLSNLIFMFE